MAPQLSPDLPFNSAPTTGTTLQNVTRVGAQVGVRGVNALYISPFREAAVPQLTKLDLAISSFIS